jgi:hypothetical protein
MRIGRAVTPQRCEIAFHCGRVACRRRLIPFDRGLASQLRRLLTSLSTAVMCSTITPMLQIPVARRLVVVGGLLVEVGRALIAIGAGLVAISEGLVTISVGLVATRGCWTRV